MRAVSNHILSECPPCQDPHPQAQPRGKLMIVRFCLYARLPNTKPAECPVCQNLRQIELFLKIKQLRASDYSWAECHGCAFLYTLSQSAYHSIHGRHMDGDETIVVNCVTLYPPMEFLILPSGGPWQLQPWQPRIVTLSLSLVQYGSA